MLKSDANRRHYVRSKSKQVEQQENMCQMDIPIVDESPATTYTSRKEKDIPRINNDLLQQEDPIIAEFVKQVMEFEREMFNLHFNHCKICFRRKLSLPVNKAGICIRCAQEKKGRNKFNDENAALPTWIDKSGRKRYDIPKVLLDLNLAEKLLIQQVSPFIPVIHIKDGSMGSRGHVVSFYQDITNICKVFPRLPSEVTIVKVVRSSLTKNGDAIEKAFSVNKEKVLKSLEWLKEHNILYSNITIDKTRFDWMQGKEQCNLNNIIEIDSPITEDDDPDRYVISIYLFFV
jgi:hypothetical protein